MDRIKLRKVILVATTLPGDDKTVIDNLLEIIDILEKENLELQAKIKRAESIVRGALHELDSV